MRQMLMNNTPMYGNDIPEVDILAEEMTDFAYHEIISHKSWRGPHYISGLYPVSSHVPHGLVVGALPYGRKAGTALADGCSPKGGTDHEGPTSVLKSVSKINHEVHTSGTLLNMRLDPVLSLIHIYFSFFYASFGSSWFSASPLPKRDSARYTLI